MDLLSPQSKNIPPATDGVTLGGDGSVGDEVQILAVQHDGTMAGDGTVASPIGVVSLAGLFGSGFDGSLNFDGSSTVTLGDGTTVVPSASVYSIARDIFATDMTVATGVQVKTQRYRVFVSGTLTLTGTGKIHQNGTAGTNGGNASGGGGGGNSFGSSGVFPATGGGGTGGSSGAGGPGTHVSSTNRPLGAGTGAIAAAGAGGRMQGGGGGGSTTAGGTTPANSGYDATAGGLDVLQQALLGRGYTGTQVTPGSGGGGGGGSSAPSDSTGGGGGAPGGFVAVAAKIIAGTGSIEAKGGNGGNATFNNGGAGAGGGGGGAGGVVVLVTTTKISALTISTAVTGGTGGTPIGGAGVVGGAGGNGFLYAFQA